MRLYLCEMQPAVAWYFFGLNENVSIVSFASNYMTDDMCCAVRVISIWWDDFVSGGICQGVDCGDFIFIFHFYLVGCGLW